MWQMRTCALQCLLFIPEKIWAMPFLAGVTNTVDALKAVLPAMEGARRDGVQDIVILLSDGRTNVEQDSILDTAQQLKDAGITIFTVGK